MKKLAKRTLPAPAWERLRQFKSDSVKRNRRLVEKMGFNISRTSDYYSPLPTESKIRQNAHRWNKPSPLAGVDYDVEKYKSRLGALLAKYWDEFDQLTDYNQLTSIGFGPGYTEMDALVLYMMIRDLKPKRYIEVGSGLSTYYCSLAANRNEDEGSPLSISCIEPYPYEKLNSIRGIEVTRDEVQNVPKDVFLELEENDVLFIDSTHVVKIDGDVAYLYLDILPILKKGVVVHIHDVPFPFNTPFPADLWVLGNEEGSPAWPMYWNEPMLLQAFLAFNTSYEISLSTPLIRHFDESFLANIPLYRPLEEQPNAFSSIWLRKLT